MSDKRPRIHDGDNRVHERVEAYAQEHGLMRPRAYHELLLIGLDVAEEEEDDE